MAPKLSLALSHYDRLIPLYDGTVEFPGFNVEVLHVSQSIPGKYGIRRHERMLDDEEFDVCEMSLSSYLMVHDRGRPFTAIPVFPRRLFSQSKIWVNVQAGIKSPKDLVGRKVGLGTMQTTLSVLAIGDMWSEYGLPWKEVHWHTDTEESMPYEPLQGTSIKRLEDGANIGDLLDNGDLDAIFRPHPPKAVLRGSKNIVPLFEDSKKEEEQYFVKNGFYPIMHVIVFRNEILGKFPEAPLIFMEAFRKADEICARYYDDPNWSRLAWGRHYLEQERTLMGANPWPNGIEHNRKNLERFLSYSLELGLIKTIPRVESLFADATRNT